MLANLAASFSQAVSAEAPSSEPPATTRPTAKEASGKARGAAEGGGAAQADAAGEGARGADTASRTRDAARGKESKGGGKSVAKGGGKNGSKGDAKGLAVPVYSLETMGGTSALFDGAPYYELKVQLPRCETILYQGCGGKVSDANYSFKAPEHYLPLELRWPSRVNENRAKCKFLKSKRVLQVQVPYTTPPPRQEAEEPIGARGGHLGDHYLGY